MNSENHNQRSRAKISHSTRLRARIVTGVFLICISYGSYSLIGCNNKDTIKTKSISNVIIFSDPHISAPGNRYADMTNRLSSAIKKFDTSSLKLIFIVGDVVDNVVTLPEGPRSGSRSNWEKEVGIYESIKKIYPNIQFANALGSGHDYGENISLKDAEKILGPKMGSIKIDGVGFVWFDIQQTSFITAADGAYNNVLSKGEYEWLEKQLLTYEKIILLFHIPLRVEKTFNNGVWTDNTNLTIDPRDYLYKIIEKYKSKILAIFNGHIHKYSFSKIFGIPLYICPFIQNDCYCLLRIEGENVFIKPINCQE